MFYHTFKEKKISALGFGAMRLPLLPDKSIDRDTVAQMVDYALQHGVNYFDTAVPYHDGLSETVLGEVLSRYPRESWMLADKFPGHQHSRSFDPAGTFERQLEKCRVDYFDFYLYHNICENSLDDYMDPRWGILEYFAEQRRLGRIKHLGFSCHATPENLEKILDGPYGEVTEFVQIQLNYLDWTLQDARRKCEILAARGIPVWVMEPVRGGKLAQPGEAAGQRLQALRPGASAASWAFRWLHDIPGVTVVLSGMSTLEQMKDNVATFAQADPLSGKEQALLADIAEGMKTSVPCTACRYCCAGCPAELDIPGLLAEYNDLRVQFSHTPMMRLETLPDEKKPHACLGCGACAQICPQGIDIPAALADLASLYDKYPKWSEVCEERNRIAEGR
ncbi:MAG: aldo/keto reductase [Bacteroidales bacterium]|nr:aldo/keto reductase [Bacteroidales bacterium]